MDKKAKRHILVPVDFSAHSETALILAAEVARCFEARLLVLHVVHEPVEMSEYQTKSGQKKKFLHRLEDSAAQMMDEFLDRMGKQHRMVKEADGLDSILVRGLPVNRILEVADRHEVQMIVMGSKGNTGLKHLMLGSVAERVVQMAHVPVTVTKLSKHK